MHFKFITTDDISQNRDSDESIKIRKDNIIKKYIEIQVYETILISKIDGF